MNRRALGLLYRGSLDGCNYACGYCPFAKGSYTPDMLARDRQEVERFVSWVEAHADRDYEILFTPWGEAMFLEHYQRGLVRLSRMRHVSVVGIQTNGSGNLSWVREADRSTLSLWISFHPSEVDRDGFVARCHELRRLGVAFSVGVVGHGGNAAVAEELARSLPGGTYLWVNPYCAEPIEGVDPGLPLPSEADHARFARIDPHYAAHREPHASLGLSCGAGRTSLSVDGAGELRRCHFVAESLGNLYRDGVPAQEDPSCPRPHCDCYIGYVHLDDVRRALRPEFGRGLLVRNTALDGGVPRLPGDDPREGIGAPDVRWP